MSTRVARVVRGLLVAVVALLVASVAHIAGGGQIGAVGFLLAFVFSSLVSIGLAGRTISRVRVGIAVLLSQGMFHLLFGVGANGQASPVAHTAGMVMGDPGATALPAASVPMADDGWMWTAHAVAAILTIVALVKGQRTFWTLAERASYVLTRIFAVLERTIVEPARALAVEPSVPARPRLVVSELRRRGPPRAVAST